MIGKWRTLFHRWQFANRLLLLLLLFGVALRWLFDDRFGLESNLWRFLSARWGMYSADVNFILRVFLSSNGCHRGNFGYWLGSIELFLFLQCNCRSQFWNAWLRFNKVFRYLCLLQYLLPCVTSNKVPVLNSQCRLNNQDEQPWVSLPFATKTHSTCISSAS